MLARDEMDLAGSPIKLVYHHGVVPISAPNSIKAKMVNRTESRCDISSLVECLPRPTRSSFPHSGQATVLFLGAAETHEHPHLQQRIFR
jgi:hypothetical protein